MTDYESIVTMNTIIHSYKIRIHAFFSSTNSHLMPEMLTISIVIPLFWGAIRIRWPYCLQVLCHSHKITLNLKYLLTVLILTVTKLVIFEFFLYRNESEAPDFYLFI